MTMLKERKRGTRSRGEEREPAEKERQREGKRRTTARVCLRREFMYAREALFTGDNRGVGLEIHTNLSDLRSFA